MQSTNTIDYWIFAIACWSFSFRAKIHANYSVQQYQITYFMKEFAFFAFTFHCMTACGLTVLINTLVVIFVYLICMDRGNVPAFICIVQYSIHSVVYHINTYTQSHGDFVNSKLLIALSFQWDSTNGIDNSNNR